jgi:hypothetical protein
MARRAGRDLPAFDLERIRDFVDMDKAIEWIIEQYGEEKVVEKMGMDRLLARLTPAQRRELKKRLQP